MPNQVHQIGRVLTVVYGESGSDPDLVGIFAQKPSADTVERSGPGQRFGHNAGAAAHNLSCDALHAPGHLAAARREKVISRIRRGSAQLTIRWATRLATVLVFPEPAPAMTTPEPAPGLVSARARALSDQCPAAVLELPPAKI